MLTHAIMAGLFYRIGGMEHRFVMVDGPSVVVVGRYYWERTRIEHGCLSVEVKQYPEDHIVVHICNLG